MTRRFADCDSCVDAILEHLGPRIVVGTPLGIGKPNALLNALYARAQADSRIELDIITALSLNPPRGSAALEQRFLAAVAPKLWPGYPRLCFVDDAVSNRLPPNVRLIEFYVQSGAALGNSGRQRHYISSNYTHVARDMVIRRVNLLLQAVAVREDGGVQQLSLSGNPDVTLPLLRRMRDVDYPWLAVAQVNRMLPWTEHDAAVDEHCFDLIVDNPALDHAPFNVPHEAVSTADWAIGLRASRWVVDGGTLQVGIGALGDAACHALRLRHQEPAVYGAALGRLDEDALAEPFSRGLYVASELISNPLFSLYEAGIARRYAYTHATLQQLADQGDIIEGTPLPGDLFDRLWRTGLLPAALSEHDLAVLRHHGVAAETLVLDAGQLRLPDGRRIANTVDTADVRTTLDAVGHGPGLRHGVALRGAFFIGPADFYARLRTLSDADRARLEMTGVDRVNALDADVALEHRQRARARFINITMKATLLGAVVSDQLADGQVVSGVGGQYNFVALAHELPDARSILLLRATRGSGRSLQSNIVWEYPHTTIPRHLRDIVITEYGCAELRGRTDEECIRAMIEIADSRFQSQLREQAVRAGKLGPDYRIPERHRHNLPSRIDAALTDLCTQGALPALPFGSALSEDERTLAARLARLKTSSSGDRGALLRALLSPASTDQPDVARALTLLGLGMPDRWAQRWQARLVRAAFRL